MDGLLANYTREFINKNNFINFSSISGYNTMKFIFKNISKNNNIKLKVYDN